MKHAPLWRIRYTTGAVMEKYVAAFDVPAVIAAVQAFEDDRGHGRPVHIEEIERLGAVMLP